MQAIDRRVLANIRQCKAKGGYLNGAGCTNACPYRDICRIPRVSFLIQTRNFKAVFDKSVIDSGVHISQFIISDSSTDEYINELTGAIG